MSAKHSLIRMPMRSAQQMIALRYVSDAKTKRSAMLL